MVGMTSIQLKWAVLRVFFILYLGFSIVSVIGGFLTAPLMAYYFFGDWRFWRVWKPGLRLFPHGWRMLALCLKPDGYSFMFNVPLTSPPASSPDEEQLQIRDDWNYGSSCGHCRRCCAIFKCPVLDKSTGLCRGYNSFFWQYFNCGRFPAVQQDIDYYECPKWEFIPTSEPPLISIIELAARAGDQTRKNGQQQSKAS